MPNTEPPMTPIRETIARAIDSAAFDDQAMLALNRLWAYPPDCLPQTEEDVLSRQRRLRESAFAKADAVLRALDEAGCVVRPREPDDAMKAAGARAILHPGVSMGGPSPLAVRDATRVYRAMISASVVE